MIQTELAQLWQQPDPTQYAAMSFLARYRGATLRAYTQDLRYFLRWCTERGVEPLLVERPHLELYLRWMEQQGLAPATIGRRFTTVAGFYRYAVIDGHCQKDPSLAVTRPRVPLGGPAPDRAAPVGVGGAADRSTARQRGLACPGLVARHDRATRR